MAEINRDGLAQYLRELRQKAGLTQSELSQALLKHGVDVHSGTISGWERAIPTAPFPFGKWKVVQALSVIFEVEPVSLFQAAGIDLEVNAEEESSRERVSALLATLTPDQLESVFDFARFLSDKAKPATK